MSLGLLLNNLALYSLQIGLLIGLAAFVPGALRLRLPSARLAYWQLLLAACLTLPLLAPWKPSEGAITFRDVAVAVNVGPGSVTVQSMPRFTQTEIVLAILGAGVLARLAWLGIGFWRLRRYRRHSTALDAQGGWSAPLAWGVEADLRISEDIGSPVTFGLFRPVVLLPANFHDLPHSAQEAILAHECLHVRRKDWLFTLGEEMVRALFWFHPGIWWLLGELELAREQAVDRLAVEITKGREEYVDALLAVAGARPALDLAPAPPFLRKRRLKHRVIAIVKQAAVSKRRVASTLAAALCVMAAACWIAAGAFPLVAAPKPLTAMNLAAAQAKPAVETPAPIATEAAAAPQVKSARAGRPAPASPTQSVMPAPTPEADAPPSSADPPKGVVEGILGTVPQGVLGPAPAQPPAEAPKTIQRIKVGGNVQLANVIRKVMPAYPVIARQARIQDHVILHALIGPDGAVRDLAVISGHPLLRQAALDAVRQWVYRPTMLNGNPVEVETDVDVNFTLQE